MPSLTVILGASPQPERYAYMAYRTLLEQNRPFALVNPRYETIENQPVVARLSSVTAPIGTVSLYLAPERQGSIEADLIAAHPQRVIFNPGSENRDLKRRLEAEGVPCLEACTLVLLRTGQF